MQNHSGEKDQGPGTLYVVSTPIGNLEEFTFRAVNVLKNVDLIAAEGVRHTRGLCRHYGIDTRLTRYDQHNGETKGPQLIRKLESGADIALVTNAGSPGVSDPGVMLVSQAHEKKIRVSPISGPSAVTAALSVSGMRGDGFIFAGFLPNRTGKRKKALEGFAAAGNTLVFFEAPHRLRGMMADLLEVLGDRPMVLMRELTKLYEEVLPGSVSTILEALEGRQVKGEITLVVAGLDRTRAKDGKTVSEEIVHRLRTLLGDKSGSTRDIAHKVSEEEGLPYRSVYRACLSLKNEKIQRR
ncbi:MAG: 16S rRNA (cytidine(1402)-2'-O)-methyltransferase [Pseudomonadota bacterium]